MLNRIIWIGVVLAVFSTVEGGSKCPSRTKIHPCVCHEIIQPKNIFTIVTCSKFENTNDFLNVPRVLDRMMIDRLVLEDYNKSSIQAITLPSKWFANIRFRELEIYNVKLSGVIGEDSTFNGQENTLVKVSLQQSIDSSYDSSVPDSFDLSVLARSKNLREINLSWNQFKSIKERSFPYQLDALEIIDLSHNKIFSIYSTSFKYFKKLNKIDLSHNEITTLQSNMFESQFTFMDFSYNKIHTVPVDFFNESRLHLESDVLFAHNALQDLPIGTWLPAVRFASTVDVRDNFFSCNCNITWIQNEVKGLNHVLGSCANPGEVELQHLRDFTLKENCTAIEV